MDGNGVYRVLDQSKFGAVVIVDRQRVFADSGGMFVLREKRCGQLLSEGGHRKFLAPDRCTVVSSRGRVRALSSVTMGLQ